MKPDLRADYKIRLYTGPKNPFFEVSIFEKRFGREHYLIEFRDRTDAVEALYNSDPNAFFRMMFRTSPHGLKLTPELTYLANRFEAYLKAGAPDNGDMVVTPTQRAVYADAYERTGFLSGMNYYRNITANWELAKDLSTKIDVPSLMIRPEDDFFLPPSMVDDMVKTVPDLTRMMIPDCGHWAMWDTPEGINAAMLAWLNQRGFWLVLNRS